MFEVLTVCIVYLLNGHCWRMNTDHIPTTSFSSVKSARNYFLPQQRFFFVNPSLGVELISSQKVNTTGKAESRSKIARLKPARA